MDTHYKITRIKDGDSLIVQKTTGQEEREIRLYGIDAPEVKNCRKLRQDERETHLPGQLLMELGQKSLKQLIKLAPPGTKCTLVQEKGNLIDPYGRSLAYLMLPDNSCVNELMVQQGYAKAYHKYYCSELPKYGELNFEAKKNNRGLYKFAEYY